MIPNDKKREVKQMRSLLRRVAELAEHVELTGTFEGGARHSVHRYNAILEHLEENGIVPEELFPRLDEDETDFGTLGAEAKFLENYLGDIAEEQEDDEEPQRRSKPKGKVEMGLIAALAPFLEQRDLSQIIRAHFDWTPKAPDPPSPPGEGQDLKTVVALAPFIDKQTLTELVRACLARGAAADPKVFAALAPHMDSGDLGQLLREYLPQWFASAPGASSGEASRGWPEPSPHAAPDESPPTATEGLGADKPHSPW